MICPAKHNNTIGNSDDLGTSLLESYSNQLLCAWNCVGPRSETINRGKSLTIFNFQR